MFDVQALVRTCRLGPVCGMMRLSPWLVRTLFGRSNSQTDTHLRVHTGTIDELMVWNREVAVNGVVFTTILQLMFDIY
jgi:hypothetical protein